MAIIAKNIPKNFLNVCTSVCTDKLAPSIAPSTPIIDIIIANFKSIFLFFIFTIIAIIDVGIKNIKFVACAICCSIPHINVSKKNQYCSSTHSCSTYNS